MGSNTAKTRQIEFLFFSSTTDGCCISSLQKETGDPTFSKQKKWEKELKKTTWIWRYDDCMGSSLRFLRRHHRSSPFAPCRPKHLSTTLHPPHRTQHDVVIRGRMEQLIAIFIIAHSPVPAGREAFRISDSFPKRSSARI